MRNKYNATPTTIYGIKFASKHEAKRYCELKLLENAKKISGLEMQKPYVILESYVKNGKKIREVKYIADFVYFDIESGKMVVEDTKGFRTQVYRLKKKLFEKMYPDLTITEI